MLGLPKTARNESTVVWIDEGLVFPPTENVTGPAHTDVEIAKPNKETKAKFCARMKCPLSDITLVMPSRPSPPRCRENLESIKAK